ncbi:group III truncated hemoglobin [Acidovorax sp. SUPP2825]|uniref:group III truncated hemoglobin n=1 Tax=Acidovorax sp. SUPP2825 TaxID=2920879 RepID=UPI0023DE5191|nr:group III truncated hemoglobin [Acidovorax sp. SUPP2825]GKS95514.1 group III truncated hemoglobin [Acidovorax sp. SUPP2825]
MPERACSVRPTRPPDHPDFTTAQRCAPTRWIHPRPFSPPVRHTLDLAGITDLVHGFYADVRADVLLGPVFDAALQDRWEPHLARMVDFWSTVALGSRRYRRNVLARHGALEGVTPAHFAAWVGLWQQHTERRFAPEVAHSLQQAAHGVARALFRKCFGHLPAFDMPAGGH